MTCVHFTVCMTMSFFLTCLPASWWARPTTSCFLMWAATSVPTFIVSLVLSVAHDILEEKNALKGVVLSHRLLYYVLNYTGQSYIRECYRTLRYICRYVCRVQKCVGGITCPNARMLKVRFGQLKTTYDTRVIHFDYKLELL